MGSCSWPRLATPADWPVSQCRVCGDNSAGSAGCDRPLGNHRNGAVAGGRIWPLMGPLMSYRT